jgi:hypothetical protein
VIRIPVELYSEEQTEWFLNSRLQAYVSAKSKLPECSPEERWARPDVFAVQKPNGKKAIRLFISGEEAHEFASKSKDEVVIVKRPGASIRCESFCPVSQFCEQWRKINMVKS